MFNISNHMKTCGQPMSLAASRKGRRRSLVALMAGVCLATLFAAPAPGQPVQLTFDPDDGQFDCWEGATIDIVIDGAATDLRGFSLVIEFDPTVIEPLAVSAGSLMTGAGCDHFLMWLNETAPGDSIYVDGATLGCSMSGPGTIFQIYFIGIEKGTSYLRCRHGLMRTGLNEPIAFDCVETTITYVCQIPAARRTWGCVKALYD